MSAREFENDDCVRAMMRLEKGCSCRRLLWEACCGGWITHRRCPTTERIISFILDPDVSPETATLASGARLIDTETLASGLELDL